jgi:hypothetical protein
VSGDEEERFADHPPVPSREDQEAEREAGGLADSIGALERDGAPVPLGLRRAHRAAARRDPIT